MNQSGTAAAQSSCHIATAYLQKFLEVSVNTLQLKDQTTMTQAEKCIPLECTHVLKVFVLDNPVSYSALKICKPRNME